MTRIFFKIIITSLWLFGSQASIATNYLTDKAFFEDQSNSLNVNQVLGENFTPYDGWLAEGFSSSTYWIKLSIAPSDQVLVLRIRPAYAESISVFDKASLGKSREVGFRHLWSKSDISGYSHNLKLEPNSSGRVLLLKVKYPRTYLLGADITTLQEYLAVDQFDGVFYISSLACILFLFLGLFALWVSTRDRVIGVFTAQQFIALVHIFLIVGYVRIYIDEYIDPSVTNYFYYYVVTIYPLVACYANKLLFEEYGVKNIYKLAFNGILLLSSLIIVMLLSGYIGKALSLNVQLIMLLAFLLLVTAWMGIGRNSLQSSPVIALRYLRIFYSANFIIYILALLPLLGIVNAKEYAAYSYFSYNMLSGSFIFLLLLYRAKTIYKRELLRSDALKREAENERFMREEQGRLMAMLTHEIRTPLSVLKLIVDRKVTGSELEDYANRAVSNIDAIIDKCIQIDQLDLNKLQINKLPFNLNELVKAIIADCDSPERFDTASCSEITMTSDIGITRIIISNLISNALKYSIQGTKIDVVIERVFLDKIPTSIKITLANKVSSENLPNLSRVFEKYYRGPSSTKVSGSGLGLFLVKELAQALNGYVECSIEDNLITFTVCIPD